MTHMPEDVREYLLTLLTALGQMNHMTTKISCEIDESLTVQDRKGNARCPKCNHQHKRAHLIAHNGFMSMPVSVRSNLIHSGWELLQGSYQDANGLCNNSPSRLDAELVTITSGSSEKVSGTVGDSFPTAQ